MRNNGPNIPSQDIAYSTRDAPIRQDKAAEKDDRNIPMKTMGGQNEMAWRKV